MQPFERLLYQILNHHFSIVKTATAILLLLAFTVSQYERYISFIECKIIDAASTSGPVCDCEKLVQKANAGANSPVLPAGHTHHHTDQLYDSSVALSEELWDANDRMNIFVVVASILAAGVCTCIEHPPSFNRLIFF